MPENICVRCGGVAKRKYKSGLCDSCSAKDRWADPEFRERASRSMRNRTKAYCADCGVELVKKSSKRCKSCNGKARWADPEYRAKTSASMRKAAATNPELREGRAKRAEAQWSEPNSSIARAVARNWADPEYRKKLVESSRSEVSRRRRSEIMKVHWRDEDYVRMVTGARSAAIDPSLLETEVMAILDRLGLDYVAQFRPVGCRRVYDLLLPDYNVLIEVDGEYWHSSDQAKCIDAEKDQWACHNGYTMIRLAERDIEKFGALELLKLELVDYIPSRLEMSNVY